jgi:NADPH2:quinone reductase
MDGVLMRALVVHEHGADPQVEEFAEPQRGEGQAIVEMGAAGLNPVDLAIASGTFYGYRPDPPFVAGREGVGRVVEGSSLAPGTRVQTVKAVGSMAERFVADEADLWVVPDGDDDVDAAALGIAGLAGWVAVQERGRLEPGERVLVLGGTGAVGLVAVQAAKLLGASRVVAAGRDRSRLTRAEELGADAVVEMEDADLEEAFRGAFPDGGPDLVIDPLWGPPALAAMGIAGDGMRLVNLGQAAGADIALPSATVRGKRLRIVGHTVFGIPRDDIQAAHSQMLERVRDGSLTLDVEAAPLADAPAAWKRLKAGVAHTKLVITP